MFLNIPYLRYTFILEYGYVRVDTMCHRNTTIVDIRDLGVNPFNPHDALKHHFTSLKTDLIFLQPRVLERKFPWNWFTDTCQFFFIFHPFQIIFIHYNSRIAAAIRGL